MAIRIPESLGDALTDAEINISVDLPKPKITTKADKDGSLSLSASYDMCEIDKLARNAARALNEEVESSIIEELLELNGYVKGCSAERTCHMEPTFIGPATLFNMQEYECGECGKSTFSQVFGDDEDVPKYCSECGAKVVERCKNAAIKAWNTRAEGANDAD